MVPACRCFRLFRRPLPQATLEAAGGDHGRQANRGGRGRVTVLDEGPALGHPPGEADRRGGRGGDRLVVPPPATDGRRSARERSTSKVTRARSWLRRSPRSAASRPTWWSSLWWSRGTLRTCWCARPRLPTCSWSAAGDMAGSPECCSARSASTAEPLGDDQRTLRMRQLLHRLPGQRRHQAQAPGRLGTGLDAPAGACGRSRWPAESYFPAQG